MISATEPRILLDRGHNFYDTLIRWQTWGSVAHAKIWFPSNGGVIIEATARGVIARPWSATEDGQSEIYFLDILNAPSRAGWCRGFDYGMSQVGKGYDFFGLAKFLMRDGRENPHRWFCSDLVFEIVKQAGVLLLARCPRYKVSPERLRTSPYLERDVLPYAVHSGSVQAVT